MVLYLIAMFFPPDPSLASASPEEVAAWSARLGSDSYRVRKRAGRELVSLGERARPLCRELLKDHDPEVRRLAALAVRDLKSDYDWSQYEPFPFLDSAYYMPYCGPGGGRSYRCGVMAYDILSPYIERAKSEYGNLPGWGSYRMASKLWAEESLRAGYSPRFIKHCFSVWRERDEAWLKAMGVTVPTRGF